MQNQILTKVIYTCIHKHISFFAPLSIYLFYVLRHCFDLQTLQISEGYPLRIEEALKPLSANPTKWSNTLKQFVGKLPTNCLKLFDHFMELSLKGLSGRKLQDLL